MVALHFPGSALSRSLAADPCALLDLLADFAADDGHELIRAVAGCHDGGGGHLAVSAFLRALADALDDICPED